MAYELNLITDQKVLEPIVLQGASELHFNHFFHSQFYGEPQWTRKPTVERDNIQVSTEGLVSLIRRLLNDKSPGADGIRKPDLLVDVKMTAECLRPIYNASLKDGKLSDEWKLANT